MKKFLIVIIGIVVLVVGALLIIPREDNANTQSNGAESDLSRLASVAITDYEGNEVSLADFEGKKLVVNSWAVWCPFCREELADFAALQEEFPDITVMAIDRRESLDKVKSFTDELGVSDKLVFLLDKKDGFYKKIGGFSMPETIFVNSDGSIVFHKRGFMTLDEMKSHVESFLLAN